MTRTSRSYALPAGPADLSKPFIPERFTPFYYTPLYAGLTEGQRLRCNQLYGLYLNEMLIFFEDTLADAVLGALLKQPLPAELSERLRAFREEEARHTEMFWELSRLAAPELYPQASFRFVRLPRAARWALDWAARHPRLFPLFIWIMLLQEDRSLYYSREFIREADRLEPRFVAAHRMHLADEAGHVRSDAELIDRLWGGAAPWLRRANAAVLRWLLGEYFNVPRRAGMRVLEQWVAEFPELTKRLPELRRALLSLDDCPAYHLSLYSRESVPQTFAGFDKWPELRSIGAVLRGYAPEAA